MLRNNFIFVFFVYHSTIRQNIWMAGWIQTQSVEEEGLYADFYTTTTTAFLSLCVGSVVKEGIVKSGIYDAKHGVIFVIQGQTAKVV